MSMSSRLIGKPDPRDVGVDGRAVRGCGGGGASGGDGACGEDRLVDGVVAAEGGCTDMLVRELELDADGERYWFRMICRGGVIAISGSVA